MGHHCRICERIRANERFSGKGHRIHVCKECQRLAPEVRRRREARIEIARLLRQRNISERNLSRLSVLASSGEPEIMELAAIVLEIGKIKPHCRKRVGFLARNRPDLLEALDRTGLI